MTTRLLQNISKAAVLAGGIAGVSLTYRYQEVKKVQSNLPKTELWSFKNSSTKDKKNVVIIGGGVVGITSAYKLATNGHKVVLLEPRSQPGKECSACAAGGMQKSNPVVDRGTWIAVTKSFLPFARDKHEQYKFFHIDWFKSVTDPFFLRWSLKFTKTSLFPDSNQEYLQQEMLKFTDYAVDDMIILMETKRDLMPKVSGYNPNGSLSLSYDPLPKEESTIKVNNPAAAGKTYEPSRQIIGKDITVQEPSILHQKIQPQSAKHEYKSRAASSERFTEELARRCEEDPNLDVTFLYNTRVEDANTTTSSDDEKCRVTKLLTNRGGIDVGDAEVLVAAGAWCPKITAHFGLYCPVYPLKGYAMSISAKQVLASTSLKESDLPSRIVSDKYMYTSRLGDEIRITSIGEFSGWSTQSTPEGELDRGLLCQLLLPCSHRSSLVEQEFRREAIRQFPQLKAFIKDAKVKCGHRPYVSDGILLLGRVPSFSNLLVSAGPGSNGWKLAMGSGEIILKLISGLTEDDISKLGFDAHSFSPAGRVLHAPLFTKLCQARWGVEEYVGEKKDSITEDLS